ncbi:protein FAM227A isoform X2 [Hemicordylus capensis]|uniref:protein FAM227A isoform X2 n=1 Tax=Hemicordylus capensis TaxID=884348 RepID=UPI002303651A|nr:protein FAM227A isoform X2 [Hemicordylus capensis]
MELITTKSFVSPLKGFLTLPPASQEKKSGIVYCKLDDQPQPYAIGNMRRVNQKITQLEPGMKRSDSSDVVIEGVRLKRRLTLKGARRETRAGTGKEKDQKGTPKSSMRFSDFGILSQGRIAQKKAKLVSEKNKLVELYQYPGYNKERPTPLPNGIQLEDILEKVVRAQRKTSVGKTNWSIKMLRQFLNAPCIQAILLDSFWWLFLHLYHPNREIQGHLFERIAENYSRSLLGCHKVASQEVILNCFPSLLSQAVYTCFCYCFSRSWFNTYEFKAQLCDTLFEWLGGTLHAPGSFNKWDYSELEPERSRREDLLSGKGKLRADSETFDTHKTNKKHMSFKKVVKRAMKHMKKRSHNQLPKEKEHPVFESYPTPDEDKSIQDVQVSQNKHRSKQKKKLKIALLPKESHPACSGPEFTWHYLNISGHSPLIQHFLQKRHAEPKTGCDIFIPRREICKPIPAQTYADVVKQGFCILHQRHRIFKRTYWKHRREMRKFDEQLLENQELARQEMQEEMKRRQAQKKKEMLPVCSIRLNSADKISCQLPKIVIQKPS